MLLSCKHCGKSVERTNPKLRNPSCEECKFARRRKNAREYYRKHHTKKKVQKLEPVDVWFKKSQYHLRGRIWFQGVEIFADENNA